MSVGKLLNSSVERDFQDLLNWFRRNRSLLLSATANGILPRTRPASPPVRAILLQDLFAGGEALAAVVEETVSLTNYQIDILGVNFVPESAFKLRGTQFIEQPNGQVQEIDLFDTDAIPVETTADELRDLIVSGSNGLLTNDDLKVSLGNPFSHSQLVLNELIEAPEDPDEDPKSYIGSWLITFVASRFTDSRIDLEAYEDVDNEVYMRGLSVIVARKTFDGDTGETITVRDVLEQARPNPLRPGVKVACIEFVDVGYGVIASSRRDMTINLSDTFEDINPGP